MAAKLLNILAMWRIVYYKSYVPINKKRMRPNKYGLHPLNISLTNKCLRKIGL